MPPGFQRAIHARNIRDEDEVISFGLFEMTRTSTTSGVLRPTLRKMKRVDQLSAFVENESVAGVYEVVTPWTGSRAKAVTATRPESHMERDVPIRGSNDQAGPATEARGADRHRARSRRFCPHSRLWVNGEEGGTPRPTAWSG